MLMTNSDLGNSSADEAEVVRRYATRLIAFARTRLPQDLARRVDPEDVVQSAYRSFFRRLQQGEFEFEGEHDVWQLLAKITYCKTQNVVTHHHRQRRDSRRDESLGAGLRVPDREPGTEDIATFLETLERLFVALPEHARQILQLRLDGYAIEEIAARVHRSRRTVLRVLAHVRKLGEAQLETDG